MTLEHVLDTLAVPVYLRGSDGVFRFVSSAFHALMIDTSGMPPLGALDARALRGEVVQSGHTVYSPGRRGERTLVITRSRASHPKWGDMILGVCQDVSGLEFQPPVDPVAAHHEFLAHISHELRTPLNAILGLTELLLGSAPGPQQEESIRMLKLAAESAVALLTDLLDLSKADMGKLSVNPVPFSIRQFCEGVLKPFAVRASMHGLRFSHSVADDVPDRLVGDPLRLRQVLQNLAGNALKFTETGSIDVQVSAAEQSAGRLTLDFRVRDTGIGIPPQDQARIFEPFVQGPGDASQRYRGTGLGLSIASRIVAMLHGRIWFESEPGVGSTFHFTVPLSVSPPPAERAWTQVAEPAPSSPARSAGLRILLVEDDAITQAMMTSLLSREGHIVEVAGSGGSAITMLISGNFDLVFMDLKLPGPDGLAITQTIRQLERGPGERIPIVAITARADDATLPECLKAGMDTCLIKPVILEDLLAILARFAPRESPKTLAGPGFDPDTALSTTGGDGALLQELAGLFLQECPRLLSEIRRGLQTGNAREVETAAHTLKGSVGNFGGVAVAHAAARLETLARGGNLAGAPQALTALDRALDPFLKELREFQP